MTEGQPPRSRFNWRCAFGLHPWGKWSETRQLTATIKAINVFGTMQPVTVPYDITEYRQHRDCERCGLHQMREVKAR